MKHTRRWNANGAGEDGFDDDALYCLRRANAGKKRQRAGLALFNVTDPTGARRRQETIDAAAALKRHALHELLGGLGVGDLSRGHNVEHVVHADGVEEGFELGKAL